MMRHRSVLSAGLVVIGFSLVAQPASGQYFSFNSLDSNNHYRPARGYYGSPPYWDSGSKIKRIGKPSAQVKAASRKAKKPAAAEASKTDTRSDWTAAVATNDPLQLVVSIQDQRVAVYKGDKQIASARVSTGRDGHSTPAGVFSIIQKNRLHHSNLYESAPMPFMQRITWSGVALHAGNVSRPYASHGCIRLPYDFAKNLFDTTRLGAHVIISAGMAQPRPITHASLPQPALVVAKAENLAAERDQPADGSGKGTKASDAAAGGLPDLIPPVEAAAIKLDEARQRFEDAVAAVPLLQTGITEAQDLVAVRKSAYAAARHLLVQASQSERAAAAEVELARRRSNAETRVMEKERRRTDWAAKIVEKRRHDPRFEGEWMRLAQARLDEHLAKAAVAAANADEAGKKLAENQAVRRAASDNEAKARELVEASQGRLSEAAARLRRAEADLVKGKKDITLAEAAVKKATNDLRISQAREKLPLRILITPLDAKEQVKTAQRLLADLGYKGVEPVGVLGRYTVAAIRTVEREMNRKQTGRLSDELVAELHRRLGRAPAGNAHMYVRQGFLDLFDVPVEIHNPGGLIGTHVFTAMHFGDGDSHIDWTALTVKERSKADHVTAGRITAGETLDRIRIPDAAQRQLSSLLTPGSSIVITDSGISNETGKGTDFVILTR